jgi:hypothetical protein
MSRCWFCGKVLRTDEEQSVLNVFNYTEKKMT